MPAPLVFDVKRYSINDGPGIRLTIFFKGCPLRCAWCHNPESLSAKPEKMFTTARCIRCGECQRVCPSHATELSATGVVTDPAMCGLCGQCAVVCPTRATEFSGQSLSVETLLHLIEKERPFFDQSGGGVTFSGGEPLLFPDFLLEILDSCGKRNIHRAVDTSGYVSSEVLLKVAAATDLFLYDLKTLDAKQHLSFTGVDNQLILENLQLLAEFGSKIQVRVPLIGGFNNDARSLEMLAEFVASLPGAPVAVSLLPFHDVAKGKDEKLGRQRSMSAFSVPTPEDVLRATSIFSACRVEVAVGG